MEYFIEFIKSDVGLVLAWVCTIVSTIFAIYKEKQNSSLKIKINKLESNIVNDISQDGITQNGQSNVYTKSNSGGMKIDM